MSILRPIVRRQVDETALTEGDWPDHWPLALRRVHLARGSIGTSEAMPGLGALPPPTGLLDLDKAVDLLRQAIETDAHIVITADFDCDGATACAVAVRGLRMLGARHVSFAVPDRMVHGYGLTPGLVDELAALKPDLLLTVDHGIACHAGIAAANSHGWQVIVTDHHLPGETLPDAVAVVDPKRADDESPFKDLCGAGVAFKLCAALEGCEPADLLEMYGELVPLGTVADVMPLVGENRTLVREGLALLQDTMRPGLQALMENAGVAGKPVTADTVSYSLAPRLNAAGRMDNAAVALKLLLCTD